MAPRPASPKYRQVHDALKAQIERGDVGPGGRLPSEADLGRTFHASRITVARAVRDLQLAGLVERRAGAGTFVRARQPAADRPLVFGMLMPDFGEVEVLSGICRGMIEAPDAKAHTLAWAAVGDGADGPEGRAWRACQQHIARRVDGVFFVPFEYLPDRHALNRRMAAALDEAGIPIVLIDRSIEPFPHRGQHDVVGLDNRRAGAVVTDHLLDVGCARPAFVGLPGAASTVDAREYGYREAVQRRQLPAGPAVLRADPSERGALEALLDRHRPDGIVCASDRTAAFLMRTLLDLGVGVPGDIRIIGIDDVEYAPLLPVRLSTLRQPCHDIGVAAMAAMVERVANPGLPPRDILLHGRLVVRGSTARNAECGVRN